MGFAPIRLRLPEGELQPGLPSSIIARSHMLVLFIPGFRRPDGGIAESTRFVPGQPIAFTWDVFDLSNGNRIWPDAHLSIKFEGNEIWPSSTDRAGVIEIADHGQELARRFFGISQGGTAVAQSRTLEYTITPFAGDPITGSVEIQIVPDSGMWIEILPLSQSWYEWKNGSYTIAARFHNLSHFAAFTFTPSLDETSTGNNPIIAPKNYGPPQGNSSFTIAQDGVVDVSWGPISQNWMWFDRVLLYTVDIDKVFSYVVSSHVSDEFGNTYPILTSAPGYAHVIVANAKFVAENAAASFQPAALFCLIVAVATSITVALGAGFAAFSGGLEGGAQVLVARALDPPEPDPDFDKLVVVGSELDPTVANVLKHTASFLSEALLVANAQLALGVTHSRVIGALAAKDMNWAARQVAQYADSVQRIGAAAKSMGALTHSVAAELAAVKLDDQKLGEVAKDLVEKGLPNEVISILQKASMSNEDVKTFEQKVQQMLKHKMLPLDSSVLINQMVESIYKMAGVCQSLAHQNQFEGAAVFSLLPPIRE